MKKEHLYSALGKGGNLVCKQYEYIKSICGFRKMITKKQLAKASR